MRRLLVPHWSVALAASVVLTGCSTVSEASPAPPVVQATAATGTAEPQSTPVPGFEDWQLINPQAVRVSVDGGALLLDLVGPAIWRDADMGVLFYRDVTGDFRATARVRTSKSSDPAVPPGQDGTAQLAGLMARTPVPAENSVFIVTGSIGNSTGLEAETTESSQSVSIQRGLPTAGDAELQLCRTGSTFYLWWRHVDSGEDWTHMSTFNRRDMPETVQLGANIYADGAPDITARFEDLRIEPIPPGGAC